MNTNRKTGEKGEQLAVQYLEEKGFEIQEINWRTGHKEIDIICRQGDFYIFIETNNKTKNHIIFVVLINKIVNLTQ
jgi:putative endonuclease